MKSEDRGTTKRGRLCRVFLIWGGVGLGALLYLLVVRLLGFGLPCLLYEVTGLSCPGCGLTRAAVALSRGDVRGALSHNVMLLPYLCYVGWLTVTASVRYVRGEKDPWFFGPNVVHITFLAATVAFTVLRNIV